VANHEFINALQKNDTAVIRGLFEQHYPTMSGLATRFAKNEAQSKELLLHCFRNCLQSFLNTRERAEVDFTEFFNKQFVIEAVQFIKAIRSEYYVASTVYAESDKDRNYSLFDNNEIIDHNSVDTPVLLKSIQELVPSQRLVFNLFVIESMDVPAISEMLEASEQTVKSNLEKARFNLQKNIEKNIKFVKNEQAL